ncbi:MAG: methyltransferase domain-containing protein [Candidatus Pelagadaptatus aseana]|uniref:class I SAM-dependent methyltransferase n=1 Tax=Candidatus Pelagadaptatus aseana TaxID=3120508 RepID=UPI0039B254C2
MSLYERYILPHVINCACGTKPVMKQRQKVVPLAEGNVLEIGMGSGLNIPFYNPQKVTKVWGLEPSEGMRQRAADRVSQSPIDIEWLDLPGEKIPLDDHCVDTIVLTFTLCTIPDWHAALTQMRRVLKPGGKLLFSEHGQAPDQNILKWQNRLNGTWKTIAGGCNLNRAIPDLLQHAGFEIETMEKMYLPSTPKIAGYCYWGTAK